MSTSITRRIVLVAIMCANVAPACAAELKSEGRAYEWIQITPKAAFAPRDGAGALVFDGRMWLLGGWNPSDKSHFPRICNKTE